MLLILQDTGRLSFLEPMKRFLVENKELLVKYAPYAAGMLVLLIVLLIIRRARKKRERTRPTFPATPPPQTVTGQPEIVVRRKTAAILKRQSLEDVLHNDAYLRIDCADFCSDSAVRRMYIKNTCIKDVYNMYQNDLRNPESPKEDGCMVLGRWVYDDQTDEYYVSLEQVVLPGDDAVFQEYELNFGGKIKLRVAENLRRLRRDTDLQYDMTCWIHSHPGLGVFFSNADNGVHMQLKHPNHPRFLTAIVVDILTPDMEMGIFTFKRGRELAVHSRQEILRLYSLEEMYQWALESDHSAYRPDDYYDILFKAAERDELCDAVRLGNGAIIDLLQLTAGNCSGLVGMAHGFAHTHGIHTEYAIESVKDARKVPDYQMLGCFIIGNHLSLPSIQKAMDEMSYGVRFVLFYSSIQSTITAIPVLKGSVVLDEKYYSEVSLEDLKIWTRRKR